RMPTFCFQAGENELVDGVAHPGWAGYPGKGRPLGWHESPVVGPAGSLVDPLAQKGALLGGQPFAGPERRHDLAGIDGCDAGDEFTRRGLPRHDGSRAVSEIAEGSLFRVQPEVGLALALVRTVTRKAIP